MGKTDSDGMEYAPHATSAQVQPEITKADAKQLDVHTESLKDFKKRVDKMLDDLEKSPASHKKIGDQTVSATAYGTGFTEADDLMREYNKVHGNLKSLSQTLGDQIETMSITVELIRKDFTGVDEDTLHRLRTLQKRMEKNTSKPKPAQPASKQQKSEGSGSTGGM